MAEFPIMPVNVSMLLADTAHMTTLEKGAYYDLLFYMWLQGGRLPYDRNRLRIIAGVTPKQWHRIEDTVMGPFTIGNGIVTQKRLLDTILKVRDTRERRVIAGRKGGRKWKFGLYENPNFPDKPLK